MTEDSTPDQQESGSADGPADGDPQDRSARATLRTSHDAPATVAAALGPDNTPDIETTVEDGTVVTTVRRRRASGLRSTVDDYLVNLEVAERTVRTVTDHTTRQ